MGEGLRPVATVSKRLADAARAFRIAHDAWMRERTDDNWNAAANAESELFSAVMAEDCEMVDGG